MSNDVLAGGVAIASACLRASLASYAAPGVSETSARIAWSSASSAKTVELLVDLASSSRNDLSRVAICDNLRSTIHAAMSPSGYVLGEFATPCTLGRCSNRASVVG